MSEKFLMENPRLFNTQVTLLKNDFKFRTTDFKVGDILFYGAFLKKELDVLAYHYQYMFFVEQVLPTGTIKVLPSQPYYRFEQSFYIQKMLVNRGNPLRGFDIAVVRDGQYITDIDLFKQIKLENIKVEAVWEPLD